ncbi:protein kinase [Streptomyces sp. NPDC005529]|uniref:protein kinase domain-containing protein n=1 Tax=unclassified Streptomyces TaxID=2593676 RepID=UPI0033BF07CC
MGEVFAGRYELVDPIGRGGVGAVWRAWDHRRRRYVAAKVLQQSDAHALLRFVREQAMRIDHPHVLAPASWAADDDKVLFTMDLVAGGSLVHLINDYGPLPPVFVHTLVDQLLAGLAAVHAEGVVHRDIKPANVLLEATGTGRPRLRLSDFGIAMRLGEPRLTETNYVVGTPGYFAPEQMLGSEPDFPADLFAVGLVALYLLEGAKPDAKALIEYFAEHGTPPAPRGIPEPLWQVVATLLQPDPQARFRTATGARKALAAAAELLPEPGPDDELIEVFDQLGPLPVDFGPEGPLGKGSASAPSGANPAALFSPGHPDSTAAHLGPGPDDKRGGTASSASGRTPTWPDAGTGSLPDPGTSSPPDAGTGSLPGTGTGDSSSTGAGPVPPDPVPPADVAADGRPLDVLGEDAVGIPESGAGTAARSDPAPSPHSSMSDTGSFHLPPPRPAPASGSSPQQRATPQPLPQAQAELPYPPPHQSPAPQAGSEAEVPTPPTSVPLPPLAPPSAAVPPGLPASEPTPTPTPHAPFPHRHEPPAAAMRQHAYAPTASYTARSAQVPPPQAGPPGAAAPGHRGKRARPRPGPPAKIAVPMLVLALTCFAVGFWALTQI